MRADAAWIPAAADTICLTPMELSVALPQPEVTSAAFEKMLADQMRAAGYTVVDSKTTAERAREISASQGGGYDPDTGRPDPARYPQIRKAVLSGLAHQLGCDIEMTATIVAVQALWYSGTAQWDGATDELSGGGFAHGMVPALSLWVRAWSTADGEEVYFNTGGIQVLEKLSFLSDTFQPVPAESLLSDTARNLEAIHLALGGLPRHAPTPAPPSTQ